MKVLIACEKSGAIRRRLRARGIDAVSCDKREAEDDGEGHIVGDVLPLLSQPWDCVIAHPPCTYISRAGARWLYPKKGVVCQKRARLMSDAVDFFKACLAANSLRVAVENPVPLRLASLPRHTQAIQPSEFGHPYTKKTLLWLRGLPPLFPTEMVGGAVPFLPSNTGFGKRVGQRSSRGVAYTAEDASRTFEGIADAMCTQWFDWPMQAKAAKEAGE